MPTIGTMAGPARNTFDGAGNDPLHEGGGNDTLVAGIGVDDADWGSGGDTVAHTSHSNAVTMNPATGINAGGTLSDTLVGIETVSGGSANALTDDGHDPLIGGAGNDMLTGDAHTADYAGASAAMTANPGIAGAQNNSSNGTGTLAGSESLTRSAFNGNDNHNDHDHNDNNNDNNNDHNDNNHNVNNHYDNHGNNGNDTILMGGLDNDTLAGAQGADMFMYLRGEGTDTIAGGAGANWIDTVNLQNGSSALGADGVDWTGFVTSGAIAPTDVLNHQITLSHDADGSGNMLDGSALHFAGLEHIAS